MFDGADTTKREAAAEGSTSWRRLAGVKSLLRNYAALSSVQAVTVLLPLIAVPYLARTLGANGLADYAIALAVAQLFLVATDYGFNVNASLQVAKAQADSKSVSALLLRVTASKLLIAGAVLAVGASVILLSQSSDRCYAIFAATALAMAGNILLPQWLYQGLERLAVVSAAQVIARTVTSIALLVVVRSPDDMIIAVVLQTSSPVISAVFTFPFLKRQLVWPISIPTAADIASELKKGWPYFISAAATSAVTTTNTILMAALSTPLQVAQYHVADRLLRGLLLLYSPISTIMLPRAAQAAILDHVSFRSRMRVLLNYSIVAAGIASTMLWIAGPSLMGWAFGGAYRDAGDVFRVLVIAIVPIVGSSVLGTQTMVPLGLQTAFGRILAGAALVNGLAFLILVPPFGALGGAWSTLITETLIACIMGLFLSSAKQLPRPR